MNWGARRLRSLVSRGVLAAVVALIGASSVAAQGVAHDFDMAPTDLADALRSVGDRSGIQLLFAPDLVAGRRSPALRCRPTARH